MPHGHEWGEHGEIRSRPGSSTADVGQHSSLQTQLWPVRGCNILPAVGRLPQVWGLMPGTGENRPVETQYAISLGAD